jgi:hypothetical protein
MHMKAARHRSEEHYLSVAEKRHGLSQEQLAEVFVYGREPCLRRLVDQLRRGGKAPRAPSESEGSTLRCFHGSAFPFAPGRGV